MINGILALEKGEHISREKVKIYIDKVKTVNDDRMIIQDNVNTNGKMSNDNVA